MEGFFLGLANGTMCISYCAPVLIPYVLGKGENVKGNFYTVLKFLIGRFAGYMMFAVFAYATNKMILENNVYKGIILGTTYVLLAVLMFFYGINNSHKSCPIKQSRKFLDKFNSVNSKNIPVFLGLLTGLNLCPPFLMAFTGAASSGSMLSSLLFFFMFFIATSLYFIPVSFIGILKNKNGLKNIGKLSAVIMSFYYLYMGIIMLF
ncbi:MAG: sulfite exporter TauE/SafE family protein [Clostridium sp.]|nr:sulfite exporter TauE/SafE family protein [Clostridium sp.]